MCWRRIPLGGLASRLLAGAQENGVGSLWPDRALHPRLDPTVSLVHCGVTGLAKAEPLVEMTGASVGPEHVKADRLGVRGCRPGNDCGHKLIGSSGTPDGRMHPHGHEMSDR